MSQLLKVKLTLVTLAVNSNVLQFCALQPGPHVKNSCRHVASDLPRKKLFQAVHVNAEPDIFHALTFGFFQYEIELSQSESHKSSIICMFSHCQVLEVLEVTVDIYHHYSDAFLHLNSGQHSMTSGLQRTSADSLVEKLLQQPT